MAEIEMTTTTNAAKITYFRVFWDDEGIITCCICPPFRSAGLLRRVIQSGLLAYFVAELRRVAKLRDARILMPDEAIRSRAIGRQARSENSGG